VVRGALAVAAAGVVFHVLDCLDGDMARTLGVASELGRIVDGLVDQLFWILLLLATGLLVSRAGGPLADVAVPLALGVALLALLNRQTRDNYARYSGGEPVQASPRPDRITAGHALRIGLGGLEYLYAPAIAFAALLDQLHTLLIAMLVYAAGTFVIAMAMVFRKAAAR
jgi:phosphatidylglycerophosphate synthase